MSSARDAFDNKTNNPVHWWFYGELLLDAAAELNGPGREIYLYPRLMLRGCGLECCLKALGLQRGHSLADDGRFTGHSGHDLKVLAAQAGITLNPREAEVLTELSDWIMRGRYPVQRDWQREMRSTVDGDEAIERALSIGWSDRLEAAFQRFRQRLVAEKASDLT
jgi:hypothetical protein